MLCHYLLILSWFGSFLALSAKHLQLWKRGTETDRQTDRQKETEIDRQRQRHWREWQILSDSLRWPNVTVSITDNNLTECLNKDDINLWTKMTKKNVSWHQVELFLTINDNLTRAIAGSLVWRTISSSIHHTWIRRHHGDWVPTVSRV